jgi:hypothetical protein
MTKMDPNDMGKLEMGTRTLRPKSESSQLLKMTIPGGQNRTRNMDGPSFFYGRGSKSGPGGVPETPKSRYAL